MTASPWAQGDEASRKKKESHVKLIMGLLETVTERGAVEDRETIDRLSQLIGTAMVYIRSMRGGHNLPGTGDFQLLCCIFGLTIAGVHDYFGAESAVAFKKLSDHLKSQIVGSKP